MDVEIKFGRHDVHYLTATYAQLVEAFGDGTKALRDDYQSMARWYINTPHGGVDLYDYKVGTCYLDGDGLAREDITMWHVQGKRKAIKHMVAVLRGEDSMESRVSKALEIALEYGLYDGDHHKMWVIDQMVRVLAGSDYDDSLVGDDWETGVAP
jgi:hypothetical protein